MNSILHRAEDGTLARSPSVLVSVWEELLGDWPSITRGGPRYLLQVRDHFIYQCSVICTAEITWKGPLMMMICLFCCSICLDFESEMLIGRIS